MAHKCFRSETSPIDIHRRQSSEVNTFPNRKHKNTKISIENEGGGQKHQIDRIEQGNLGILALKGIAIIAEYLPSMMNTEADRASTLENGS